MPERERISRRSRADENSGEPGLRRAGEQRAGRDRDRPLRDNEPGPFLRCDDLISVRRVVPASQPRATDPKEEVHNVIVVPVEKPDAENRVRPDVADQKVEPTGRRIYHRLNKAKVINPTTPGFRRKDREIVFHPGHDERDSLSEAELIDAGYLVRRHLNLLALNKKEHKRMRLTKKETPVNPTRKMTARYNDFHEF